MLSTFHVFPLPPRKEIQLLPRFLCCVLFIWVLVEESVTTGVSSMAFFVVHAGFSSRVREKTKTFLTSLTSFQELHLMWVWVTAFFVSFNEHNYFNFLTVTRTINLRRCMASDLKYTSFLKTGRRFIENASCGVCSSRICLSNAKPAKIQTKRKQGFKTDFSFHNTSITLLSPFNEKCFCFKTFLMFWLSVKNFAFCYLAFVSSGFFNFDWSVRQNAPWMNQNCFVVTWLMTYVCLHFLHPHRKETYIKKLSNILLTDPQLTWGGNLTDFNFPRFCKKRN